MEISSLTIFSFLVLAPLAQETSAVLRNLGTLSLKGGLSIGIIPKGKSLGGSGGGPLIQHHYSGSSSKGGGLIASCCKGKINKLFGQKLYGYGAFKGEFIKPDKPTYTHYHAPKYPASSSKPASGGVTSNEVYSPYNYKQTEKYPIKLYKPNNYDPGHGNSHNEGEEYSSYKYTPGKYNEHQYRSPQQGYERPGPLVIDGGKGQSQGHYDHAEYHHVHGGDYHGEKEGPHTVKYNSPPHSSQSYPPPPPSTSHHDEAYPHHEESDNGPHPHSYNDYHSHDHHDDPHENTNYGSSPPLSKDGYSYSNRIPPPQEYSPNEKESYPASKYPGSGSSNSGKNTRAQSPPFHRGPGDYHSHSSDHGPNTQVNDHHHNNDPQDYPYYNEEETKYPVYPPNFPAFTFPTTPAPRTRPLTRRMVDQSQWKPVQGVRKDRSNKSPSFSSSHKLPQGLSKDFKYRVYEYGENEMIVIDGGLASHEKDLVRAHVYSKNGGKLLRTIEIKDKGKDLGPAVASDRSDTVMEEEDDKPSSSPPVITSPSTVQTTSSTAAASPSTFATTPIPPAEKSE